jgi:glyoxylase-like metal-dependent hydrolase (beta-lactamase superfamily II)
VAEAAPGHPDVLRIVAPNPGPMTLEGTNTYVVGSEPAWVIDPGPDDESHLAAIRATGEERGGIAGVLLTHGHSDHTAGAVALGAPIVWGEAGRSDEVAELSALAAGEPLAPPAAARAAQEAEVGPFAAIATPGHAVDHFAFVRNGVCFCGDVVLGEGSSIVAPSGGGGSLADYMASLERLSRVDVDLLAPGHGPWITDPAAKIASYREHRLERERRLVAALEAGERSRERLLATVWDDVPEVLRPAAAIAMEAHLEKLAAEGLLPQDVA